ncbi:MAG: hypothetical protein PVH79_01505 [Candidatus Bathyarchaeota archaeon]|jgi:hypothetical protein
MLEIKGRLPNSRIGVLRFGEESVTILEERGLLRKRLEKVVKIQIFKILSVTIEERKSPFRSMIRLTLRHKVDDEDSEIMFFSNDRKDLEEGCLIIEDEIERLKRERDAHVHHISLVLRLTDQIFKILLGLYDSSNWDEISRPLEEAKQIIDEMKRIRVVGPISINVRGLATSINRRNSVKVREEAYAIISLLRRDSERIADFEEKRAFDLELHKLFLKSYLLLWDLYFTESLGTTAGEKGAESLLMLLDKLGDRIDKSPCKEELCREHIEELSGDIVFQFDELRIAIHRCLKSLTE